MMVRRRESIVQERELLFGLEWEWYMKLRGAQVARERGTYLA